VGGWEGGKEGGRKGGRLPEAKAAPHTHRHAINRSTQLLGPPSSLLKDAHPFPFFPLLPLLLLLPPAEGRGEERAMD